MQISFNYINNSQIFNLKKSKKVIKIYLFGILIIEDYFLIFFLLKMINEKYFIFFYNKKKKKNF